MTGIRFPVGAEIFLFATASWRHWDLLIQSPVQWVQGLLHDGVKRSEREADHYLFLVPRLRLRWDRHQFPIHFDDVMLKCTGNLHLSRNTIYIKNAVNITGKPRWSFLLPFSGFILLSVLNNFWTLIRSITFIRPIKDQNEVGTKLNQNNVWTRSSSMISIESYW
jgi:hypothetical protein